jgi:TetR/AcrR family transcriptional regulator
MASPLKMASPLRQRGEATRLLLLDEAERQFSEFGFRGASLSGIAAACGIGNAGALHHFASKEKLYKAVLLRLSDEWDAQLQSVDASQGSAEGHLRQALHHYVEHVINNPQRSRLILREILDNLGRVEHARTLPLSNFVATFCKFIEAAQQSGAAAPGPAIAHLTHFLGALSYALVVRPTYARMEIAGELVADETRWIATVAALAMTAILPQPQPSGQRMHVK